MYARNSVIHWGQLLCKASACLYIEKQIIRFTVKRIICAELSFAFSSTAVIICDRKLVVDLGEKELSILRPNATVFVIYP